MCRRVLDHGARDTALVGMYSCLANSGSSDEYNYTRSTMARITSYSGILLSASALMGCDPKETPAEDGEGA